MNCDSGVKNKGWQLLSTNSVGCFEVSIGVISFYVKSEILQFTSFTFLGFHKIHRLSSLNEYRVQ